MDFDDSIDVILSAYRDKVSKDLLQRLKEEYRLTLSAEADCRRSKMKTDIKTIAKLRLELNKLKISYSILKEKTGIISSIERFIEKTEISIESQVAKKNRRITIG